jgi:ribose/xylose/arabinose/galactoside ABC-type transport system permease subunit
MSTVTLAIALSAVLVAIAGYLLVSMYRSIRNQMRKPGLRKV